MKKEKKSNANPETTLQDKWSQKRVVYTDTHPYLDPGIDCSNDPSRTDQSQAPDCDINKIVSSFLKTGVLPGINGPQVFADVSDPLDYHQAMDIVLNAENQFMSLDAHTRKRFANDPALFLEFASDPQNGAEMIKLGLALPKPLPADPVPAVANPEPKL